LEGLSLGQKVAAPNGKGACDHKKRNYIHQNSTLGKDVEPVYLFFLFLSFVHFPLLSFNVNCVLLSSLFLLLLLLLSSLLCCYCCWRCCCCHHHCLYPSPIFSYPCSHLRSTRPFKMVPQCFE